MINNTIEAQHHSTTAIYEYFIFSRSGEERTIYDESNFGVLVMVCVTRAVEVLGIMRTVEVETVGAVSEVDVVGATSE